ncbi:unnamed protein product, partial [Timema podura]|nr:unnamed protein product [Timema podura]
DLSLYRQNPSNPITIQTGVDSSLGNFNANRQTKFVIHGWNSNGNSMATVRNVEVDRGSPTTTTTTTTPPPLPPPDITESEEIWQQLTEKERRKGFSP